MRTRPAYRWTSGELRSLLPHRIDRWRILCACLSAMVIAGTVQRIGADVYTLTKKGLNNEKQ